MATENSGVKNRISKAFCRSLRYLAGMENQGSAGRIFVHGALTYDVLGCAYEVHRQLGPGLLESAYRTCLLYELNSRDLPTTSERPIGLKYKDTTLDIGYRADLVVDGKVLIELKAIDRLQSIHEAQLLTYLRLSGIRVGLLINFNVSSLRTGIRRFVK